MVLGRRSNTFNDFNDPRALLHVQNNNHHQTAATPLEQSQIIRQYHACIIFMHQGIVKEQ